MPKIVTIITGHIAEMLTDKQERFVQELIKGKSQREAYKAAYNASAMKDRTIDKRASDLFKKGDIRGRYDELRKSSISKTEDDAESMRAFIIAQLKKIASGEICDETIVYDADGNITSTKKTKRAADVKDAMKTLAEYYGVSPEQAQSDNRIIVTFEGEDYGA